MSDPITREEFTSMIGMLDRNMASGFKGLNERFDRTDARVGKLETKQALTEQQALHTKEKCHRHTDRIDALEERVDEHVGRTKATARNWGVAAGAIIAAIIEGVSRLWK